MIVATKISIAGLIVHVHAWAATLLMIMLKVSLYVTLMIVAQYSESLGGHFSHWLPWSLLKVYSSTLPAFAKEKSEQTATIIF